MYTGTQTTQYVPYAWTVPAHPPCAPLSVPWPPNMMLAHMCCISSPGATCSDTTHIRTIPAPPPASLLGGRITLHPHHLVPLLGGGITLHPHHRLPPTCSDGLHWHLEGRSHARQCLLTSGLLPMLSAPGPSGDEVGTGGGCSDCWVSMVARCHVKALLKGTIKGVLGSHKPGTCQSHSHM
jgi:hypothetical protein